MIRLKVESQENFHFPRMNNLTTRSIDRIIEMAREDRITFDAIKFSLD